MHIDFTNISEDDFDRLFGHIEHKDGGFFWDLDTDRAELERLHAERRLWTAVDGDDGTTVLCSGFRFVNRFAYVVAARPYAEGVTFECELERDEDDNEEPDEDYRDDPEDAWWDYAGADDKEDFPHGDDRKGYQHPEFDE